MFYYKEPGRDIHVPDTDQTFFGLALKVIRLYKKRTLFVIRCGLLIVISVSRPQSILIEKFSSKMDLLTK